MAELHVKIHHEGGSYWAEIPELPGCFASAHNPAELVEAVREAVALYLDEHDEPPQSNGHGNGKQDRAVVEVSGLTIATDRDLLTA